MTEPAVEPCAALVSGSAAACRTAASLLARRGDRVIALEKARHRHFHICEPLLPTSVPLFEPVSRLAYPPRLLLDQRRWRRERRYRLAQTRLPFAGGTPLMDTI